MITRDMNTAVIIGRILLIIAAFTVTSFPVLYWFVPWYRSRLGQAIMLQAATLALAVWLKFTLTFFLANGPKTFLQWTNDVVLTLIIVATSALTYILYTIRRDAQLKEIEDVRRLFSTDQPSTEQQELRSVEASNNNDSAGG
jgi:Kef-type K+ transport system membrane component KefB